VNHLGQWLSALVDGELDGTERDRVLNHVAGCQPCRQEANAMRALKRRLTALGETSAEPAITGRLIELARGDHDAAAAPSQARTAQSGWAADWGPRLVAQSWRIAAASAGGALVAIGAIAFLLGNGAGPPVPKVTPSVDSYLLEHAYDAGQAPAGPPLTGSGPAGQPQGTGRSGPGPARPGHLGRGQLSHRPEPLAGSGSVAATGAAGPVAASPTGPAAASPTASPDASPTASPDASPFASTSGSPSPGPYVPSRHPG